MEEALEAISDELGMEPRQMLEHIKALPKAWVMEDLRVPIDCLLKENAKLKTQGRLGREAKGGGGVDCDNLRIESPGTGGAREGGYHGPEIPCLHGVFGRRSDQGKAV